MDTQLDIRPARAGDAAAIARLSGELGYPATAAEVATRLAALARAPDDNAVRVATLDGAVVGWIHVLHARRLELPPFAEIAALVIDAGHRNAGLGERLVDAAVAWARAQGLDTVRVRSNVVRADAHRFYRRLGFADEKAQGVLARALP
ncbi:GNAT family N-acetyltransferase [Nitrogeniibacter mangrovi]|uniref:GNAT family N-acetyltransferase n=1 Tax=Nitrogeniibacter mangrovi TaxID=2016596 RepID=A0A6C1B6M6_9RHOO|nr:GNAT family N-acetyltransferase [Nitrogeniibacter mangrovi]QID18445.1 GNAT family N-acetyltransferase [Nitrogeniibacter mangrovi]